MSARCVAVLGGSFDPVHRGHVALAGYFADRLQADQLRIVPAGNPWQKNGLRTGASDRIAMLDLAFAAQKTRLIIDQQEIQRHTATYSIDTLRALRAELGPETSIAFLMGADQLQQLHTWRDWKELFDYAHLCAASRPGFDLDPQHLDPAVAAEFSRRIASAEQLRRCPSGLAMLGDELAVDISATQIRTASASARQTANSLPERVLDYIQQHHLYKN